jgi:hypothetical protein
MGETYININKDYGFCNDLLKWIPEMDKKVRP